MRQRATRVCGGAGFFDGGFAQIGSENLNRKALFRIVQKFHQADGDGISLLARGAPRHPDADGILRRSIVNQHGEYLPLQFLEDRRFPEKRRDGDKTVLAQSVCFIAVLLDVPAVSFQRYEAAEGHAPLDAPRQSTLLVVREVYSGSAPHQPQDSD